MLDFIAESRPRKLWAPTKSPTGFVAEARPSSRHRRYPQSSVCPDLTELKPKADHLNLNCNDDLESALNDILCKKSFSKEKITQVMNETIIKLINKLLSGYNVSTILGSINVSLVESDEVISVNLNEHYIRHQNISNQPKVLEVGLKYKNTRCDIQSSPLLRVSPCPDEFCCSPSYFNRDIPDPEVTSPSISEDQGYLSPNLQSPPSHRRESIRSEKSDSEGESGYCSGDRESLSDEGGEETKDSIKNENVDNQIFSPLQQEYVGNPGYLDAENDNEEPELIIDLSISPTENAERKDDNVHGTILNDEPKTCSKFEIRDSEDKNSEETWVKETESRYVESAESKTQASSPGCDLDVPMDLSGDCKVNVNTQVTPKEEDEESPKCDAMKLDRLKCKKCPAVLPDPIVYQEHTLQNHQLHACATCFKDFSSKNNLKRHVRIHTGSRPFKCSQCEMSFARKDDLKGHTLRHDYSKPFRCSLCKKGYTDRACVKNHMLKEHCSRLMQICPECGESFDRDDAFLEHKKSHPSLKQFSCDICLYIGTNHLMALKHKLLHSHKLFSCKPCNAYFSDPFGYTKHVRKHKKTKDYSSYVCCFCDTVLPTYEQFVRHEYSHAQGKLHECSVCKKQFKSKSSMLEHVLVHSDSMACVESVNDTVEKAENHSADSEMDCLEEKPSNSTTLKISNSSENQIGLSTTDNTEFIQSSKENEGKGDAQTSFEGKLLDLSLKSSIPEDSCLKEHGGVDTVKQTAGGDIFDQRMLNLSNLCVPRNGCAAIEIRVPEQEKSTYVRGLAVDQTRSKGEEFHVVWQSPKLDEMSSREERENNIAKLEKMQYAGLSPQGPFKRRERVQSDSTNVQVERNQVDNKSNRHHPYSKMVELASKFVAARGSKLLKEIGNVPSGVLLKNEPITVTSLRSQVLLKPVARVVLQTDTSVKMEQLNSVEPSNQMVIGLSGKPCLAPIGIEEPSRNNDRKTSPVFKQEVFDDESNPAVNVSSFTAGNQTQPMNTTPGSSTSINTCESCNLTFGSFFELESHTVSNHKRYLCEFCGKGFTARPNRDRHVRYHTGERPYKCDLCPSAFCRGDDLKYHRTTRHPSEQLTCKNCSASFNWQKDLERHLRHSKCQA